jgi:transcriptional regulator with XRE-family HTH domain
MVSMDVATLIARCRTDAGLTQRQLAERAGTSAAAVCLYESGRRVPRVDTLTRLVAATGASLVLRADPAPAIDVEANGRALEAVLELADHLPRRSTDDLDAPVFASMAA